MGVLNAFEPSKTCTSVKLVDPKSLGPLQIDASASTFMLFKKLEGRLLLQQLKKDAKIELSTPLPITAPPLATPPPPFPELESARKVSWMKLAIILDKIFNKSYDKSKDVIHYDGPPTQQKAYARNRRGKARSKADERLLEVLRQAETRLCTMEKATNLSNRKLSRFQAFLSKTLFPLWITTRGIDTRATKAVAKELHDAHGWTTHICDGQFDLCAGKMAHTDMDKVVVVTTDSDLQFMGVDTVIRFQPRGTKFYRYSIQEVLEHCGLETVEEWKACAMLAQNDYDPSVARTSFKRAIEEVIKIRESWKQSGVINQSARSFAEAYCELKRVPVSSIKNSLESFIDLKETTLEQYTQGDDDLDNLIQKIIFRVQILQQR